MVIFIKRENTLIAIPLEKIIVVEQKGERIQINYHCGFFYREDSDFHSKKNDVSTIEILYLLENVALKQMQDFYRAIAKNQTVFYFDSSSGSGSNGKG